MLTITLVSIALLIAVAALTLTLVERRRRHQPVHRNGDGFVAWDWPTRPVNGHDHPEPPELAGEREPAA